MRACVPQSYYIKQYELSTEIFYVNGEKKSLSPCCVPLQEAKAAYGMTIMGVFWLTEVIPLPATALMPMFLFPMLGVMGAKDIAKNYLKVSEASECYYIQVCNKN